MNKTFGESKDVALVQSVGEQFVGGINQTHIKSAFDDVQKFRSTRVSVGWVHGAWWILKQSH
ncbi:hypothetical protein Mapa_004414 [Marchantia paleacea]|nr:hypothetical protein Mapa_004414 [Marchantia paleacea]